MLVSRLFGRSIAHEGMITGDYTVVGKLKTEKGVRRGWAFGR